MLSNFLYYQSIFEETFEKFLVKLGVSEKTRINYRSDLRNFVNWLAVTLDNAQLVAPNSPGELLSLVKPIEIENYKTSQIESKTPPATVNRRLSSVRIFFQCAVENHWLSVNPADKVANITKPKTEISPETMLGEFEQALIAEGAASTTIRNYVTDVEQFLHWLAGTN